jgi:hypothetical protein
MPFIVAALGVTHQIIWRALTTLNGAKITKLFGVIVRERVLGCGAPQ